jgi:hypothetical protein
MHPSSLRMFIAVAVCGSVVGCNSNDVNNPKMPEIAPVKIQVDTVVPKAVGDARSPYGASKKYQDMMNH